MPVAAGSGTWTLEQLHALPDDGNRYEVVRGELFVTPAPGRYLEYIATRLAEVLMPFVAAQGLGHVFRPRAVVRFEGSEVEPDLLVRHETDPHSDWDSASVPCLVVEILSHTTRQRDTVDKRALYLDAGVGEYWIVDPDASTITVVRRGTADRISHDVVHWHPEGATASLAVQLGDLFRS